MAENGHLKSNNNNKSKTSTSRLNIGNDQGNGRTESDATHFRLRRDQHPSDFFICRSCNHKFEGTSLMQVYAHYAENEHNNYYALCFYCQGKVHQYFEERNSRMQIYHSCLRWKSGENK